MKPANLVATVFKVIILNVVILTVVAFAFNMWRIFDTQKRVDSIGNSMAAEIARNNTLMFETVEKFSDQLVDIEKRSGGRFQLKSVAIQGDGVNVQPVEIITSGGQHGSDAEYVFTYAGEEEAFYNMTQGKYGDFITVQLNYDVYIPLAAPRKFVEGDYEGGHAIKTEFSENETTIATFTIHSDQTFEYTTPCLRYIK